MVVPAVAVEGKYTGVVDSGMIAVVAVSKFAFAELGLLLADVEGCIVQLKG